MTAISGLFCFAIDDPIPQAFLADLVEVLMSLASANILRVKGILNIEGEDRPTVVHGEQYIFRSPATLPAWPNEDRRSRIIFITHDVSRELVEKTFQAFRQISLQAL